MSAINQNNPTDNVDLVEVENDYWVAKAAALGRLEQNDDFKNLILDGYFKDKAVDGVSLLAADYIKRNGKRADVMETLIAISQLQDYFITIKNLGEPQDEVED